MPVPRGLPLGSKITVRPGEDSFVLHRAVRIVGQFFGRGNHFCRLDGYYEDSFSTKWYPEVELCRRPPILGSARRVSLPKCSRCHTDSPLSPRIE